MNDCCLFVVFLLKFLTVLIFLNCDNFSYYAYSYSFIHSYVVSLLRRAFASALILQPYWICKQMVGFCCKLPCLDMI